MQIFIFLMFALCGVANGVVYDLFYLVRGVVCGVNKQKYTLKDKVFTFVCDVIYCIVFAISVIFLSICLDLYEFRLYFIIACAFGLYIYLKSLHLCIAFLFKKVYNTINKSVRRRRASYEGRKTQQNCRSNNR